MQYGFRVNKTGNNGTEYYVPFQTYSNHPLMPTKKTYIKFSTGKFRTDQIFAYSDEVSPLDGIHCVVVNVGLTFRHFFFGLVAWGREGKGGSMGKGEGTYTPCDLTCHLLTVLPLFPVCCKFWGWGGDSWNSDVGEEILGMRLVRRWVWSLWHHTM